MTAPLVSIIVPFFNAQDHLSACLQSIQGQTIEDWECVCVDDGSDDCSPEIAAGCAVRAV
jgi:CDP-glycerol glycerophosphotransferase